MRIQPRWRNLLLARALLLAVSVVLASSGQDIEPYTQYSAERNLSSRGDGSAAVRGLHSKSKSAKVWSKSGSKGSKSKPSKSWSGKGSKMHKASKSKAGKSTSSTSKSLSSSAKMKVKSVAGKSGVKSKSAETSRNGGDEGSLEMEPEMGGLGGDSEMESGSLMSGEAEEGVASQSISAEVSSVYFDSEDAQEGEPLDQGGASMMRSSEMEGAAHVSSADENSSPDVFEDNDETDPGEETQALEDSSVEKSTGKSSNDYREGGSDGTDDNSVSIPTDDWDSGSSEEVDPSILDNGMAANAILEEEIVAELIEERMVEADAVEDVFEE